MRTFTEILSSPVETIYRKVNRRPLFYILSVLAAVWPVMAFLLTMDNTCYYTASTYTVYGYFEKSELMPEMVGILLFVVACAIIIQIAVLYVWTGEYPIDGYGPIMPDRKLSIALSSSPSLSEDEEMLYFNVSAQMQKGGRVSRVRDLIALL